ncbi:MAG TPA: hypothetical protein PLL15_06105 [Syntrophales bacterium]|nr:hypothetical protein [Syntrophales bacterium]
MDSQKKKGFEVIREGLAKARFGGVFSGGVIPGQATPLSLAAIENNAGLDPAEYYVTACRLLSAAVTPYRKFDFSKEGVLKTAVPLFDGLTLYANHDADVNDWKGMVQEPVWDDANQPPGINAKAVFDRTVDPKLVRGVETRALRAFSVTIWFEYVRSHPDLAYFYDRLGEVIDGQMVRFIVTKIVKAGEVSVVWEGEDPFAKAFSAGGAAGEDHKHQSGGIEMKLNATALGLLGIAAGTELTESLIEGKISEVVTGLKTEIEDLKPDAALGKQLLADTRQRAVTLYKALKGDKFQQAFVDGVISKADLATARALISEYEAEVEKGIPLTCPKCGEKLSRRSSMAADPGDSPADGKGKRAADYKL